MTYKERIEALLQNIGGPANARALLEVGDVSRFIDRVIIQKRLHSEEIVVDYDDPEWEPVHHPALTNVNPVLIPSYFPTQHRGRKRLRIVELTYARPMRLDWVLEDIQILKCQVLDFQQAITYFTTPKLGVQTVPCIALCGQAFINPANERHHPWMGMKEDKLVLSSQKLTFETQELYCYLAMQRELPV